MTTKVKICGLSTPESVSVAIEQGADFIGFVFYPPSPRHVEIDVAKYLTSFMPDHVQSVGLFVNPDNKALEDTLNAVPLSMIQLHGSETPERVSEIKDKFNVPVMKALPIKVADDLVKATLYDAVADWLLFDAPPLTSPPLIGGIEGGMPGGNGVTFDWSILDGYKGASPWMLAGGLTPDNVQHAIQSVSPTAVDVSSGVESAAGVKDSNKISAFIAQAKLA